MTVAAVLVAYAACLGVLGSRMLGRARWTARAPLLAIVVYLAAGWSVIAALGLAGLTLAVHATALGGGLSHLVGACVHRLRATYGTPGGATVAGLGLTLAGAVLARTALTATTYLRVTGRQALHHAQTARLVGRPAPALGAVLVEHDQPAAYCVAGRQPTVILTTGAMQALDPGQLDAVLAHERAHLAGRHHRLLAVARIGRQVLPFMPLMRDAEQQVARPSVMNNLPAGLVLPDMRIHHQNGPSGAPARRQDNMTDAQAGRLRWRPRRRRDRGNARCAPGSGAAGLPAAYGRPVTGSVPRT